MVNHTLVLTGDINLVGVTDPAAPFARIAGVTRNADIVFGNLECCFYDKPGHDPGLREGFYAPSVAAEALLRAGFDAVGCANNVTYGDDAIRASLAQLDALGIASTGAGRTREEAYRPAIVRKDGRTYGFLQRTSAYWPKNQEAVADRPGVAVLKGHTAYRPAQDDLAANRPGVPPEIVTWTDPEQLSAYREDVAALSRQTDFVVASHHWGYKSDVLAYQTEIAHAAIDSGADIVLGHGPHFPLGAEIYRDRPILYGACNFSFNLGHREPHMGWIGYFATVEFANGAPAEVYLRLVRRTAANETILCDPAAEQETVNGLVAQSETLGATLQVDGDKIVVWRQS